MVQNNITNMIANTKKPASAANDSAVSQKDTPGSFDKVMQERLEQEAAAKGNEKTETDEKQEDVTAEEYLQGQLAEQNTTYPPIVFQWMTAMTNDSTQQSITQQQSVPVVDPLAITGQETVVQNPAEVLLEGKNAETVVPKAEGSPAETNTARNVTDAAESLATEKTVSEANVDAVQKADKNAEKTAGEPVHDSADMKQPEPIAAEKPKEVQTPTSIQGLPEENADDGYQNQTVADIKLIQPEAGSKAQPEATVHVRQPEYLSKPENMEQLGDTLAKQIASGKQEFEIQLEPLHLGKMLVKVTFEAGKAAVSIICSETKTMQAIAQNAKEIGSIMENHMGTQTQIILDKGQTADYLEQNQQQEKEQQNQNAQKEQHTEKDDDKTEALNFLQQLRLGLV